MEEIRYVPIGDSYTAGVGATPQQSWPYILTDLLVQERIPVTLVATPASIGHTTADVIEKQLPLYVAQKPTFTTLLIGVNDFMHEIAAKNFHANLSHLVDRMMECLPSKKRLIMVTIPDFSVTPKGALYGLAYGRDAKKGISEYNSMIIDVARTRQLNVADIYPLSQMMHGRPHLVAEDLVHPSAAEYALWAAHVLPIARDACKGP